MYGAAVASPGMGFGVETFLASSHARNTCGNNGLPLTPNSVRILGKFQRLKTITHPHLCAYLDLHRGKHERLVIVSEHYYKNCQYLLSDKGGGDVLCDSRNVQKIFCQVLHALQHLHSQGIVHHAISLTSILLTDDLNVKLSQYGMYYMTEHGTTVQFPIGKPEYMPPEVILNDSSVLHSPKTDVWSLGVVLLQLALKKPLFKEQTVQEQAELVLKCAQAENPTLLLVEFHKMSYEYLNLSEEIRDVIEACLSTNLSNRPSVEQLLIHKYSDIQLRSLKERSLVLPPHELISPDAPEIENKMQNCSQLPQAWNILNVHELYYFWKLAGGCALSEVVRQGYVRSKPPILTMQNLALLDGEDLGQTRDSSYFYCDTVLTLQMDPLKKRLKNVEQEIMFKSLTILYEENASNRSESFTQQTAKILPLIIRERDIEYQIRRIFVFRKLIEAYPLSTKAIVTQARTDIPPYFRGHVWAALLGAQGDYHSEFNEIDKESPTAMDRQIDVDIPRCHQYDQLLSSPTAHEKFKRLLKAWVASHPQYVYWQGLDSLCAPFIYLHFNNEALAYQCLSRFIDKYLHKFFLQDNSLIIKEYLAVFSHLISYHDPILSNHLDSVGFIPELYSIPWFLTMYTHVFPLHKVYHLWDSLLLRSEAFPLCVGVAILQQLRDQLLKFGFNECILMFSDMPDVDMSKLVQDAVALFEQTPPSTSYRSHSKKPCPGMVPLSLETLKLESGPRLSLEDLLSMMQLIQRGPDIPKERVLIVDVRSKEEHLNGCIPSSINIPCATAFTAEGVLSATAEASALAAQKGSMVVVMGGEQDARDFANKLIKLEYPHVVILQAELEDLHRWNVLVAPINM